MELFVLPLLLRSNVKNHCIDKHCIIFPMFSSGSLTVSAFTFKSLLKLPNFKSLIQICIISVNVFLNSSLNYKWYWCVKGICKDKSKRRFFHLSIQQICIQYLLYGMFSLRDCSGNHSHCILCKRVGVCQEKLVGTLSILKWSPLYKNEMQYLKRCARVH